MAAWISYYKYMRKRLSSYSRRTAVFDKLSTTADECFAIAPVRVSCADSRRQVRSVFCGFRFSCRSPDSVGSRNLPCGISADSAGKGFVSAVSAHAISE